MIAETIEQRYDVIDIDVSNIGGSVTTIVVQRRVRLIEKYTRISGGNYARRLKKAISRIATSCAKDAEKVACYGKCASLGKLLVQN